ncbi:MAG: FAD-dependent oxidoreductase [Parvibaculum sp.]|uniref:FAD-dependent oxidoreductase n=1 Tax=Parvibaculum sp. TaxID=2024848 RepID=UPI001DC0E566|nr:FAD-dependent oxidoreductase [Parvibaculum sp.]MBX3487798.1 FAD-dependent oxidoreductase [Parvibaculum sp.]MBX3497219.1 FAD-dependent oxidoreductase [Parvibaculum sp.]MCW5729035.1 FAD-dependent oxidoreductase [Parvibaculum sp.]
MTATITTTCAIAGGGPAGMMLGLLLARAGIDVTVLEKHKDFLRDFRGDTIHPSTLEVMHELGLLDVLLARPHEKMHEAGVEIGGAMLKAADFSHLPTRCKFIAFMPQWHFLDFLAETGRRYPGFHLRMETEVTGLIEAEGGVAGLRAATPDGLLEIRADLVVGADGRGSVVRERAGLAVRDFGAPMDVLWMRLSRRPDDPSDTLFRVVPGHLVITINRGDYWQCAFVIEKGAFDKVKARGLDAFRADIARVLPMAAGRIGEITSWDDVKLLTVKVDRLREWARPGLLCIGDAAHAMSPVGGVGINLAIQDAVAAANILAGPLRERRLTLDDLCAVQRRRMFPTRVTQAVQVLAQRFLIGPTLRAKGDIAPPLPLRLLNRFPLLRRIPGYAVGIGARPEHVREG